MAVIDDDDDDDEDIEMAPGNPYRQEEVAQQVNKELQENHSYEYQWTFGPIGIWCLGVQFGRSMASNLLQGRVPDQIHEMLKTTGVERDTVDVFKEYLLLTISLDNLLLSRLCNKNG